MADAVGIKEDLALMWKNESQVGVINYFQWHILMKMDDENQNLSY